MKNLLILLTVVLLIFSCSKEEVTCIKEEFMPNVCIDDICIDGEWDWIESHGSIAGVTITPDTEMISKKLIITETNYQEFVDGKLILDTEYEYVKSNELEGFTNDGLILKLSMGNWFAVFEEDEKLILFEPCYDCWKHTYERR